MHVEVAGCMNRAVSTGLRTRFGALGRFAFGLGGRRLAFRARRFGFAARRGFRIAAGRRGSSGLFLGALLVIFTAVIGDVKTAPFKNQTGAGADLSFDFAFAPFFLGAKFLGTRRQRMVRHGLRFLEVMTTFFTGVFVSRHKGQVS